MPGEKRHAVTLTHIQTYHIKNTYVVCCTPKTLYGVFPYVFMVYLFSTLLITYIVLIKYPSSLTQSFNF